MGDYFQKLAAPDVGRSDAAAVAKQLENWLVENKIAGLPKTDNVLSSEEGFPPGENADQYVVENRGPIPRDLWTNGIDISNEPTVFHESQGFPTFEAICPKCASKTSDETFMEGFGEAYASWIDDEASGIVCPACDQLSRLTEWRTDPDCLQAANVGVTIWNWPPISEALLEEIKKITQSEIVYIFGKL